MHGGGGLQKMVGKEDTHRRVGTWGGGCIAKEENMGAVGAQG